MKAILLVGGLGTRLRSAVPSLPKTLAPVGGRPFLELLVSQLQRQGIRELVMCTGYLAEQIKEVFGDGSEFGVEIEYSQEHMALGTAGALKLAQRYVENEPEFFVLNGDSLLEVDFNNLLRFHRGHEGLATMAAVRVENASRYGTLQVGTNNRILGFVEKSGPNAPGLINAGIYVFDNAVLSQIPNGPVSLERNTFPQLLEQGVYAAKQLGLFIDIGIPEDYALAREISDRLANLSLK